jgi:hypothetical protein
MKVLITAIIAFALGFFVHAYFYTPESLGVSRIKVSVPAVIGGSFTGIDKPNTFVDYKNDTFQPSDVTIHRGRDVTIRNTEKSLMWLESDCQELNTVRGYGETEQLRVSIETDKTCTVTNKLNLNAKTTIHAVD